MLGWGGGQEGPLVVTELESVRDGTLLGPWDEVAAPTEDAEGTLRSCSHLPQDWRSLCRAEREPLNSKHQISISLRYLECSRRCENACFFSISLSINGIGCFMK